MTKYRLKKDTPEFEAGQMFNRGEDEDGNDCLFANGAPLAAFDISLIDNFDEWFEVAKPSWKKPKFGEKYYFLNNTGNVCADQWVNDALDEFQYLVGECFKTRKAAEAWRDYRIARATVSRDEGVLIPKQVNELIKNEDLAYYVGYAGNRGNREVLCGCTMGFDDCCMPVGVILFDTEEHADASCRKHQDEWKIILNYDWSRND